MCLISLTGSSSGRSCNRHSRYSILCSPLIASAIGVIVYEIAQLGTADLDVAGGARTLSESPPSIPF
jgi:hypothetical protein